MGRQILDPKLMSKIAKKLGKDDIKAINVMVSKKAAKLGISSEAALILLAKENEIGTSVFQRKIDPQKHAEVRDYLPAIFAQQNNKPSKKGTQQTKKAPSRRAILKAGVEYLIQDPELQARCGDILLASSHFDRPINQATLVLEDRIRKKAKPNKRLVGENLVGYAFNEDINKTILRVASNDPEDQRGFTQILRGVVGAFRNKTHHHLTTHFSQAEALRVCAFIDVLLRVVDNSQKIK